MGRPKGWRKHSNNDNKPIKEDSKIIVLKKKKGKKRYIDKDDEDDFERYVKQDPVIRECQPCSYLLEEMWTIGVYDCLNKSNTLITDSNELMNNSENSETKYETFDYNIDNSMSISSITKTSITSDHDAQVTTIGLPVWSDDYFTDHISFNDNDIDLDSNEKNELDNSFTSEADVEHEKKIEGGDVRTDSNNNINNNKTYNKVSVDNVVIGERKNRAKKDKVVTLGEICEYLSGKVNHRHVLIKPRSYNNKEENWGDQPFEIKVHPQVGFLCDIHSHLCDAEVIGLLAGKWDKDSNILYVQAAFPCTTTSRQDDGSTDVEMDPIAELKVREIISNLDLQVIGWFHSHPKFCANPSVIDIENQSRYQDYMDCPFIGLIVSTYDENLPTPSSHHQWFHVKKYFIDGMLKVSRTVQPKKSVNMPMRLNVIMRKMKTEISKSISSEIAEFIRKSIMDMKSNNNSNNEDDDNDNNNVDADADDENISKKQKFKKMPKGSADNDDSIVKTKKTKDDNKVSDLDTVSVKKRSKRTLGEEGEFLSLPNKVSKRIPFVPYDLNQEVIFIGGDFVTKNNVYVGNKGRIVLIDINHGWYSVKLESGEVIKARHKQVQLVNEAETNAEAEANAEAEIVYCNSDMEPEENLILNQDDENIMDTHDIVEQSNEQLESNEYPDSSTHEIVDQSNEYPDSSTYDTVDQSNEQPDSVTHDTVDQSNEHPDSVTYDTVDQSNEQPDSVTHDTVDQSNEQSDYTHDTMEQSSEHPDSGTNDTVDQSNEQPDSVTHDIMEQSSEHPDSCTHDTVEQSNGQPGYSSSGSTSTSSSTGISMTYNVIGNFAGLGDYVESPSNVTTAVIEEPETSSMQDDNNSINNDNCDSNNDKDDVNDSNNVINEQVEEIEPSSSLNADNEQNEHNVIPFHFQGSGGYDELGVEQEVEGNSNNDEKESPVNIRKKPGRKPKKDKINDVSSEAPPTIEVLMSANGMTSTGRQIKIPKSYDGGLDYDKKKSERREALREAKKLNAENSPPTESDQAVSKKKKVMKEEVSEEFPSSRSAPVHKRKRRQISNHSLIEHLQGNHDSSLKALELICNASVTLRFPSLCIATLTFYYGKHQRRTDITKSWKKINRIEKIRLSAIRWTELFGLNEKEQNEFIDLIITMISSAWSKDRRSNQV